MSDIFGNSYSTSSSSSNNANKDLITGAFTPTMNMGIGAGNMLGGLLGLNGSSAQSDAFNNWRNSTGYQFGLNQGTQSIVGNAATQGLLNSGATAKALQTYGQNYANTQYGNYFNQLSGLLQQGLNAGQLIGNVGQQSSSQARGAGQDSGGIGNMIGDAAGAFLGK